MKQGKSPQRHNKEIYICAIIHDEFCSQKKHNYVVHFLFGDWFFALFCFFIYLFI